MASWLRRQKDPPPPRGNDPQKNYEYLIELSKAYQRGNIDIGDLESFSNMMRGHVRQVADEIHKAYNKKETSAERSKRQLQVGLATTAAILSIALFSVGLHGYLSGPSEKEKSAGREMMLYSLAGLVGGGIGSKVTPGS
jgi:hypothetical protein